MDGILNVRKEKGYTSHDVVAKLRGILGQRKIGHTGTLDPDATGVLPVCLGKATKVCEFLTDKSKTYVARVRLGVVTDTQDMTGQILEEHPVRATLEQIREAAEDFVGEIWQTPPMYSAVKVDGRRLYELARQGVEVERKKRRITVYSCEVSDYSSEDREFTMRVECSRGTYIRTLCHDIGQRLSCGGAMASLVRVRVGMFELEQALTLSEISRRAGEGTLAEAVMPIDGIFASYPKVVVEEAGLRYLRNGNIVRGKYCRVLSGTDSGGRVRMYDEQHRFYAVYRYDRDTDSYVNVKMFYQTGGN